MARTRFEVVPEGDQWIVREGKKSTPPLDTVELAVSAAFDERRSRHHPKSSSFTRMARSRKPGRSATPTLPDASPVIVSSGMG